MKTQLVALILFLSLHLVVAMPAPSRKDAEFSAVVKLIESYYHVKTKRIPTLAKMGMKAAEHVTRFSEYGSLSAAIFEDQNFDSATGVLDFSSALKSTLLPSWQLLIETYSRGAGDETFVFTKQAGERFKVLVVAIGGRDGTAVQAEISPHNLAVLLKDPKTMGKILTDESTTDEGPD